LVYRIFCVPRASPKENIRGPVANSRKKEASFRVPSLAWLLAYPFVRVVVPSSRFWI
jgi:hypothetical protein